MNRANKALVVMFVASLGLWGCAQEQSRGPSSARIRALESKNAKLEDDFRVIVASRDEYRKKLQATEQQRNRLNQQIEQLHALERERTSERDVLQTQFDQLRKGMRNLLGQVESVSNATPGQPVTSAAKKTAEEKS
jgi:outer membrane murein-binding lipoprotein Lpp